MIDGADGKGAAQGAGTLRSKTLPVALVLLMTAQAICSVFFVFDVAADFMNAPPKQAFALHNDLELLANAGLIAAIFVEAYLLRLMLRRAARSDMTLRAAQGAMADLLVQQFEEWGFTASESDVARFTIKGFSIAEVAALRGSTEATVKAHLNAVYRKAGVQGRGQLVATFVEDLFLTA